MTKIHWTADHNIQHISDPDLTSGDGVYSAYLSPQVRGPGSYSLMVTVTNGDNETFLVSSSPQSDSCCGSAVKTEQSDRVYTGAFVRHVEGPVIIKDTAEHTAPGPRRVTDLEAEYREEEHEVSLCWSVQEGQAERFTLSYSHDIDSVIRGLETRDVAIIRVRGQGRVSQVLPGPEVASPTIVYYVVRAEDSAGRLSLVSNIVYLNITRGSRQDTWIGDTSLGLGDTDYTLLGVVLGVITVFSLLTILAVSAWLTRRRASSRDKLRAMNGFTNKVSSTGVNVVIDKTDTSRDLSHVTHVASGPSVSGSLASSSSVVVPPSSTSFANNITPTYWSASQLLADHETRSRKPREAHHHHGQHYHQYYPVHHQLHHHHYDVDDQDMSDILEDNNNDVANSSDQSSSTIVMLNTSMSSSNTGTGGSVRKKNITQV